MTSLEVPWPEERYLSIAENTRYCDPSTDCITLVAKVLLCRLGKTKKLSRPWLKSGKLPSLLHREYLRYDLVLN